MSNRTKAWHLSVLFANLMLLLSSGSALAVPLSSLLAGDEIIASDMRFYNFRDFGSTATGRDPAPATAAGIEVVSTSLGDEIGLRFSSSLWVSPADVFLGPGGSQTTQFSYDVQLLGLPRIVGNTLSFVTNVRSLFSASTRVSETARSLPSLGIVADSEVHAFRYDFNLDERLQAQATFAAQSQMSIQSQIYVQQGGARISEFSQTFKLAPVPEPTTLGLMLAGLVMLVGLKASRGEPAPG